MALQTWRREFAADIIGEAEPVVRALDLIRRTAPTDLNILITGETGAGKELFARAIHRGSNRHAKPFIAVNCAAIPESLFEAELFGHARGAFTGATDKRAGRFLAADGGTLFLDEIGDLPLPAQAKLLRVLEHGTVSPLGSDSELHVDVRIVAATHRDLEDMVARGTFRADLYFRLAVVNVLLPALRERLADFDRLLGLALATANRRGGCKVEGFDEEAYAALRAYRWPGNIRELVHRIERAVVMVGEGRIRRCDLQLPVPRGQQAVPSMVEAAPSQGHAIPQAVSSNSNSQAFFASGTVVDMPAMGSTGVPMIAPPGERPLDLRVALEHLERRLIDEALQKSNGNRTVAAALLGLNRTTLAEKLRKYVG